MDLAAFQHLPSDVRLFRDDTPAVLPMQRRGTDWIGEDVTASLSPGLMSTSIRVHAPHSAVSRVAVRWAMTFPQTTLFLGDAWERAYGDLQWRSMQSERVLPWYLAAHDPVSGQGLAVGVKTQPAAMCFWTADPGGVSLWLDLRNGGCACVPGDRWIDAATVVGVGAEPGQTLTALIRRLCTRMCDAPRAVAAPVCGNNNWYYAYGQNFDADQVRRDAALLAELAGDAINRPYCVIDAGWSPGSSCPGGPFTAGRPGKFPSMPRLAEDIGKTGVRAGIWIRPTALTVIDNPNRLRPGPQTAAEKPLDLTLPENLASIHDDIARMHQWGYQLIKHDFSTWDALGRWGFEMGAEVADAGWHFADRSRTNAEILLRLYQTIRAAAGDAVLIGCNTVGHLAAGLFELQRGGDDTSGRIWERTRRMGVNTLAYRLPQHGTFFQLDADCVAHTDQTPWEKDRQWLDLVSRSGTSLFVSVDPMTISPQVKFAMATALRRALAGGTREVEPVDLLTSTTPSRWTFDGQAVSYSWDEPDGPWPFKC